ncbi:MAG: hypothetical protein LC790_05580 [Actinobacteria bacterium]|nr:hypothetical protein [Actinomycetota bacterium]
MTRRVVLIAAFALVLIACAWPPAVAKDLGTDVLGNISPESRLGAGALVDRYPLSAFSLDYSTDVGITELDGVPPTIAHWSAAQIWSLSSFLIKSMIDLFAWAFSLDLLGVEPGQHGALEPVADAITSIYENVLGEAWMAAAIVLAGIWGIWRALIQRRYTETFGALAVSVVFVVIALFFVYEPEKTVGTASRWTNELSLAFLAGANTGSLDDPAQAKRHVADQLYSTLIYEPWVVLQFGGLQHCVDLDKRDGDGYPKPVGPHDPARDLCRNHLKQDQDGHGGYAPRFLRSPAGSDEREAEYEALRSGEIPEDERDGQFRGYAVDKSDSPAVDVQQEGGAYQRLTLALVFFIGSLGAVLLLGDHRAARRRHDGLALQRRTRAPDQRRAARGRCRDASLLRARRLRHGATLGEAGKRDQRHQARADRCGPPGARRRSDPRHAGAAQRPGPHAHAAGLGSNGTRSVA